MVTLPLSVTQKAILPPGMVSVILIEDSEFVRLIWHKVIERIEGLTVVGSFSHVEEAITYVQIHRPQIILLDLEINGKTGLDVLNFVATNFPHIKVFVVTNHPEEMYRTFCLDAGAYAFFEKGIQFAQLVAALEDCAARKDGAFHYIVP